MTTEAFLEEVLQSKECPEGFEETYRDFQRYQKLAMDTLKEFHRLCEANGIRYQLAYGSLIGAVRDGGQIPWDYDIDVFVPYKERDKLVEAVRRDLSDAYYAWSPELDDRCDHSMMRLAPKGYDSEALHVDVFYLIGLPEDPKEQASFLEPIPMLFHARSAKRTTLRWLWKEYGGNIRLFLGKVRREKLRYAGLSLAQAEATFDALCSRYDIDAATWCAPATYGCEKCIYETAKVFDTQCMELADGTFRVPKDPDHLLTGYYGDFRSVPPLKTRLEEMMKYYRKLLRYEQGRSGGEK